MGNGGIFLMKNESGEETEITKMTKEQRGWKLYMLHILCPKNSPLFYFFILPSSSLGCLKLG